MKQFSKFKKPISVLLASCFIFTLVNSSSEFVLASQNKLSAEEEKAVIEQRIKETNNKLNDLKQQSADTQEYFDTLSSKIDYLEQEMDLVSDEVEKDKITVSELQDKCEENEKEIKSAEEEIEALSVQLDEATAEFNDNYQLYCKRMRAIYVSGETNVLTFLLTSNDISEFLTRYEMIRRISKQDGDLLEAVDSEMKSITESKSEITVKQETLTRKQNELLQAKAGLESSMIDLQAKQTSLDNKRTSLSSERAQANVLLKKLSDETGHYTEFLEDDKNTLREIDDDIAAAADKYADKVTTTTTTTTTKKPSSGNNSGGNKTTTTTTSKNESSSNFIQLTYPVPSQTTITCGFHGYAGHSGADFKCPSGSTVVAAESGTVIISADLTNEDGSYRSYGRYIVIMHDKTTSSGDKVYTLYAHNSKRLVSEGQHVNKGQKIAESGSTGNSTGPHCHFEVRTPSYSYSNCKNPANYLP